MTHISLRGTMLVAVSALALAACTSDSSNSDALAAANATIASKTATIAERDAAIAAKNATIAEKDATIAAKQASIDAANASIASLTTDKVNLLSTVVDRNEAIDGLESDIDDLQAEIDAANADIASLEADIAYLQAMVDAGDADIVDLQAEIAGLESEIDALTAENAGLDGDLSAANATIAAKQAEIDAAKATIVEKQAALDSANSTIATHLATIATRDATIVAKNADIAEKAGTISGLQDDVAGLEDDVAGLEGQINVLDGQIDDLESDISALEADKAALQADKDALIAANADLQSQVTNYNKTAFNANRGKTSYENGGYKRSVGDAGAQTERDAVKAAEIDLAAKQDAKVAAIAAFATATSAYDAAANDLVAAQSDYSDAQTAFNTAYAFQVDGTYDGQSLASYLGGSADDAAFYAEVMGLDITNFADLAQLVSVNDYLDAVQTLMDASSAAETARDNALAARDSASDARDSAQSAQIDANDDVAAAQVALSDAQTALASKGTADAVRTAEAAVSNAESDLATKLADEGAASAAVDDAQADYDAANAFVVNPGYDGQTLATYFADLQSDAEFYAEIMGLDVTDSADQGLLVDATAYAAAVGNLYSVLTSAQTALTNAQGDVATAQADVTTAETALAAAIQNYHDDRLPQQSSTMTLYQADGSAVSASGAMVYKQSLADDLQQGQGLEEAGRLTALFLLDDNGDPTNVLVFEASMLGASSEANPFTLPAGAATFESSSMVAAFAQLEGGENGSNTYSLQGDTEAGSLTINFDDNTGRLVVVGLVNGANQDFSVNADLTFDPETGMFSADAVNQAYTSATTGLAEVATGDISGALSAVADAFTAYIDTTDVTGINNVDVKIMTRIVGTGSVTLAPVTP